MEAPTCGERPLTNEPLVDTAVSSVPQHNGAESLVDGASHQVHCWACSVVVQVPLVGESKQPAPVFKCGWCGAITEFMHLRPPRGNSLFRIIMRSISQLKWGVVIGVTVLILSLVIPGAVFMLPQTCESSWFFALNHVLTWFLSFNVFWNFFACVFNTPGTVNNCFVMPVEKNKPIHKGAFESFTYCYPCKFYKPPSAHHCSMCNACVIDMDHHCPFINNCVGRANMRNFLLFLAWALIAVSFAAGHAITILFFIERTPFIEALAKAWMMRRAAWDIIFMTFFVIFATPWRLLIISYILCASLAVMISVGALLFSQLRHLAYTPEYGPQYERQRNMNPMLRLVTRLEEIMGQGAALSWIWPEWGPPVGTCPGLATKKAL